jgi:hypothetical protein
MYHLFEKMLHPFPAALVKPPPRTLLVGAFEALLFAAMGRIVDLLGQAQPDLLWSEHRSHLLLLGAIVIGSVALIGLQTVFKHQVLSGNFPMMLRWNFHRLMLNQSMSFYQDEFAGRIAAKVMQTALAVRDIYLIVGDILVFITIYIATMVAVVGAFVFRVDRRLYLGPGLFRAAPEQDRAIAGRRALADDRPHHRCLYQYRDRETVFPRRPRSRLCAHGDAGFPADGVWPDAPGQRFRSSQSSAGHAVDCQHRRCGAGVVDARRAGHWRGGGGDRDGAAAERHFALGDVGNGGLIRTYRHGAGRYQYAFESA